MTAHEPTSRFFKANARAALGDANIQRAMRSTQAGFVGKRTKARAAVPEFDAIRDSARDLKNHVLANLDTYLEQYEARVTEAGGHVHWCQSAMDARAKVLEICERAGAKKVNKGKTMVSEEIGLNDFLSENGVQPVETDLGEYIIQLRGETPSHIIAPAVHVTVPEIDTLFRETHTHLPGDRDLSELSSMLAEARSVLRQKYFEAEVGITGANMLVAETGQSVIVTNEGNGDLSQSLPRVHIVLATLEKIVPTLDDASTVLRVLARSATGQEITVYTTFSSGPRRAEDPDGPEEYHVILLDNGRTDMLGSEFQDMLRCIRCGACMNHCPVYQAVGGHAYGWVYPGPMGAVLTPSLIGVEEGGHLPNASTFCGRCEEVCPMRIPLPRMMRSWRAREYEKALTPSLIGVEEGGHLPNASTFCGRCEEVCPMRIPLPRMMRSWRAQEYEKALTPVATRYGLGLWKAFATRPGLYRLATRAAIAAMGLFGRKGRFASLPLAGGWTAHRDFPAPEGGTFMAQWKAKRG